MGVTGRSRQQQRGWCSHHLTITPRSTAQPQSAHPISMGVIILGDEEHHPPKVSLPLRQPRDSRMHCRAQYVLGSCLDVMQRLGDGRPHAVLVAAMSCLHVPPQVLRGGPHRCAGGAADADKRG